MDNSVSTSESPRLAELSIAIIGAGPAGLMAAEVLSKAGHRVEIFDAMPSSGRKFLLAGKGGMNITHSEALDAFISRYAEAAPHVANWLRAFGPEDLRTWVHGLGISTFVGSSGRVFPIEMKAAPLLRAWLQRLRAQGVRLHMRTRWLGWAGDGALRLVQEGGEIQRKFAATVLALGGASWPRLGSDGAWYPLLAQCGIDLSPLKSSNCGFDIGWSAHFVERFAGHNIPTVGISHTDQHGESVRRVGPCVITATGVEGTLIYALSSKLRQQIEAAGQAQISLDLLPDWTVEKVAFELCRPRGTRSWASHLQSRLGLKGVKVGLLREVLAHEAWQDPVQIAHAVKDLTLNLRATRPIEEVISSAGGICLTELDQNLMLSKKPGVFCAGEMLDWEAPTGGYLLTACFASGYCAGQGVHAWLARDK